jgi:hypothetical protein
MTIFRNPLLGILVLILLGQTACLSHEEFSEEQINALMQEELLARVDAFVTSHRKRCEDDLFQNAVRQVDSLLLVDAFYKRDTTLKPHKPIKPEHPVIKTIKDTTPVKPFFKGDKK